MQISFTVLGSPQGKERPRFSRFGKIYTPSKTKFYEDSIRANYMRSIRHKFSQNVPLEAEITAFYEIPKSVNQWKRKLMENGKLQPIKKPDGDNVIKIILDALNGVGFHDDAQICRIFFEKRYAKTPKVCVKIRDLEAQENESL